MEIKFPLILDGATGTELQKRGFTGDVCTEQWALDHPEAILDLQGGYAAAGSNVVYAPTFSANPVKLEENGLFNCTAEYNRRLVELSRQAVDGKTLVAGDISPTGKFLAPIGNMSFEDLVNVYREQAAALEAAGVDLFVVETMMTVSDARAAVLAIRSVSKKPIFVTFTCDKNGQTVMGCDITAVLEIMQGMEIDAFGLNCSVGPEDMAVQLRRLQKLAEVPLIAKPNAGLPETIDGKTVYNCPPVELAAWIPAFAEAGVQMFGGCCGTDASHIAAICEKLKTVKPVAPKPEHPELLPAATEKRSFLLPADVRCSMVLSCDETLADHVDEITPENCTLLGLHVDSEAALDALLDNQLSLTVPVCFLCEDAEILEQALRIYQGRALYEGNLPEKVLEPLRKRYGLIF